MASPLPAHLTNATAPSTTSTSRTSHAVPNRLDRRQLWTCSSLATNHDQVSTVWNPGPCTSASPRANTPTASPKHNSIENLDLTHAKSVGVVIGLPIGAAILINAAFLLGIFWGRRTYMKKLRILKGEEKAHVEEELRVPTEVKLTNEMRPGIRTEVENELRPLIRIELETELRPQVRMEVENELRPLVRTELETELRPGIEAEIKATKTQQLRDEEIAHYIQVGREQGR